MLGGGGWAVVTYSGAGGGGGGGDVLWGRGEVGDVLSLQRDCSGGSLS